MELIIVESMTNTKMLDGEEDYLWQFNLELYDINLTEIKNLTRYIVWYIH